MPNLTLVRDAGGRAPDRLDALLEEVRCLVEDLETRRNDDIHADVEAWERRREFLLIQGGAARSAPGVAPNQLT